MFLFHPIASHHLYNNTQYYSLLGEIQLDEEYQYIYQLHYSKLKKIIKWHHNIFKNYQVTNTTSLL